MFFLMEGGFGLYSKYYLDDPRKPLPPFIVMRRHMIYGDY